MSLTPGSRIVLRRRTTHTAWLATDYTGVPPAALDRPDDGWLVHQHQYGGVMLECLSVAKSNRRRYLRGDPATGAVTVDLKSADGTGWLAVRVGQGAVALKCFSRTSGPAVLTLDGSDVAALVDAPGGKASRWQQFIPLPAADAEAYHAAEADGDYSHLVPFGMTKDGKVAAAKKEKPEGPTLTPGTPRERAGKNAVALELIAALQPSFDDAAGGAENSDYPKGDPRARVWPHNIVALDAVATKTGIVHRHGEEVKHAPPPGELARCRKLAAGVAAALDGLLPFGGDAPEPFRPFYLVVGIGEKPPVELTDEVVRAAFRGTLFPDTPIDVKTFAEAQFADHDDGARRPFVGWAAGQKGLRDLRYVCVGYDGNSDENFAAVFPRLVLGLTKAGSLVGACGSIVQA